MANLKAAGVERITPDLVRADVEEGAPTNEDGTINLIEYAAWLAGKVQRVG